MDHVTAQAFQQGRGGWTFVVSRVPMPWPDTDLAVDTADQMARAEVER